MKNLLSISILSLFIFYSCVSVRFPETIKVDISVPSDFDIDKIQILIDTLKGFNKKDHLHKAEVREEKNGVQQKGMTAPRRN